MALQQKKLLSSGIEIDYWRIVQMNMNYDRLDCVITLSGYLSKEARDNDSSAIDSIQIDLSTYFHEKEGGELILKDLNRSRAYEVILELAELEIDKEDGNQDFAFFLESVEI